MDRCDTDPHLFLFANCGRPFFFCTALTVEETRVARERLAQLRRRFPGSTLELRSGNYAAATQDEVLSTWPEARVEVCEAKTYVYVAPYDLHQEA